MPARRLPLRTSPTAVAAAATVLLLTSAVPAQAATQVFREKMNGFVVEASSFSVSDDGCIASGAHVTADRRTVRYDSFTFDECEGVEIDFAFATGSPAVLEVDRKLSTAHLVADVTVHDPLTGELTDEVIELDLTWEAVGPATKVRESFSESRPGEFRFRFHTVGTFAPAAVEGFGDGEVFGRIGRASTMVMTLVHDGAVH